MFFSFFFILVISPIEVLASAARIKQLETEKLQLQQEITRLQARLPETATRPETTNAFTQTENNNERFFRCTC